MYVHTYTRKQHTCSKHKCTYVPITPYISYPFTPTHLSPDTHALIYIHPPITHRTRTHSLWVPREECKPSQPRTTAKRSCHIRPQNCLADPRGEHRGRKRTGGPKQAPLRTLADRQEKCTTDRYPSSLVFTRPECKQLCVYKCDCIPNWPSGAQ